MKLSSLKYPIKANTEGCLSKIDEAIIVANQRIIDLENKKYFINTFKDHPKTFSFKAKNDQILMCNSEKLDLDVLQGSLMHQFRYRIFVTEDYYHNKYDPPSDKDGYVIAGRFITYSESYPIINFIDDADILIMSVAKQYKRFYSVNKECKNYFGKFEEGYLDRTLKFIKTLDPKNNPDWIKDHFILQ